jgi:hypothetical protein
VAAFAQTLLADLPTVHHVSRFKRLAEFLDDLAPAGAPACGSRTNLARSVEALVRRFPRPGPVVVLSDLYDPEGFHRGLDLLRYSGYEPRLVHLVDPEDARTDLLGDLELVDAESQSAREVTVTGRAARRYRALVAEFHGRVADYARRCGMAWMRFPCDMAEDEVLLRALGARRGSEKAPRLRRGDRSAP